MQWALDLAETGWLPDAAIRAGIRRLLRSRISSLESAAEREPALAAGLRTGPIALATDRANEQHYELPPRFFEIALGKHLKYSCCYWPAGIASLDAAEAAALELACERAKIRDGMKILDLGCGWGSLSLWIAERHPSCRITSVSNSAPQGEFIRAQARARGLGNVEVLTADMNTFAIAGTFDRIVSVEMFEHMRNYAALLERVASWLEPDGKLFVHVFCHREHSYLFEDAASGDWMARHFFTGGLMPSELLLEEFAGPLALDERWRVNGRHYQKTALAWLDNIDRNRNAVRELFTDTYGAADAERWRRRWRMFFLACAELFGHNDGNEWFVSHSLWSPRPAPAHYGGAAPTMEVPHYGGASRMIPPMEVPPYGGASRMINSLKLVFALVLLSMLAVTAGASLDRGVFEAAADLWGDPWFRATLADAYFGFLAVYLWIAYKESSLGRRMLWFVLLMLLGNIAIAIYLLIQLFRLPASASMADLLLRNEV